MSTSVAVLPGIFSGSRTTRRLRQLLHESGHTVTANLADADIVIAHSAGCLDARTAAPGQIVVLVNPPYWPGRTIRERVHNRMHSNLLFYRRGISFGQWAVRNLWGIWYALSQPRRNRFITRHMAAFNLPEFMYGRRRVIIVRNELDDWLTPELDGIGGENPDCAVTIIRLPGDHDDFNYNPGRYVDLLQSIHEQ